MKLDKFEMEVKNLRFINQDFMNISYATSFSSIPFITATSVDDNDINVFAENITSSSCTIRCSSNIKDGLIHVQIIGIK